MCDAGRLGETVSLERDRAPRDLEVHGHRHEVRIACALAVAVDATLDVRGAGGDHSGGGARAALAATPDGALPEGAWLVRQVLDDPAGDHDWAIVAAVNLDASDEAGAPVLELLHVGPQ